MKTHQQQKLLYLFNDITCYFCSCFSLYCSNSLSYWYVFKMEWSLMTLLEAFNKTTIKPESHKTSHWMSQNFQKHYSCIFLCINCKESPKDLWHFDRVSAYFSDASQNFPMHKISLASFWIGWLMYKEQIKVIIRQADPYDKTGDGRGCKIWLHQNI